MQNKRVLKWTKSKRTSLLIIDAQSVKNVFTAEEKGYDAGKKISWIKRHIAVDTLWLPHMIGITTGDYSDREGAKEMFLHYVGDEDLDRVKVLLVDGGYSGEKFKKWWEDCFHADIQVIKRNELHAFKVLPKRWIVERTFSWLDHCRRLWKNCERHLFTSLTMLYIAFISLVLKRY